MNRSVRLVVVCLGLLIQILGCTSAATVEEVPAAASLYFDADPMAATDDMTLLLVDPSGDSVQQLTFATGVRIVGQIATLAGSHHLRSENPTCELALTLEAGIETDVRFAHKDGTCSFIERGRHDATQSGHIFGALAITVNGLPLPGDAFVVVRSVDDPPNPAPDPVTPEPDRQGHFQVFGLAPGGYEVSVVRGGAALVSASVVIAGDGRDERLTLEVLDPS